MNRRNFFQSLAALAGAASVSPLIFLPKFDPVRWKALGPSGLLVPNPAYHNAVYEFIRDDVGGYWSLDLMAMPRKIEVNDPRFSYPLRYSLIDSVTFRPVPIPPFIKQ